MGNGSEMSIIKRSQTGHDDPSPPKKGSETISTNEQHFKAVVSGTAMNLTASRRVPLLVLHRLMCASALQVSRRSFCEGALREVHPLSADVYTVLLAQLSRQRVFQKEEACQSLERVAAVAAAVSVAVEQEQVSPAGQQVSVDGTDLDEVQSLGETEQPNWVALCMCPAHGQSELNSRRAAYSLRKLKNMLNGMS